MDIRITSPVDLHIEGDIENAIELYRELPDELGQQAAGSSTFIANCSSGSGSSCSDIIGNCSSSGEEVDVVSVDDVESIEDLTIDELRELASKHG